MTVTVEVLRLVRSYRRNRRKRRRLLSFALVPKMLSPPYLELAKGFEPPTL